MNWILALLPEYYTSSALFMSSSGVFLIAIDGSQIIEEEELDDEGSDEDEVDESGGI